MSYRIGVRLSSPNSSRNCLNFSLAWLRLLSSCSRCSFLWEYFWEEGSWLLYSSELGCGKSNRWKRSCESSSIGSYFLLKYLYNWLNPQQFKLLSPGITSSRLFNATTPLSPQHCFNSTQLKVNSSMLNQGSIFNARIGALVEEPFAKGPVLWILGGIIVSVTWWFCL